MARCQFRCQFGLRALQLDQQGQQCAFAHCNGCILTSSNTEEESASRVLKIERVAKKALQVTVELLLLLPLLYLVQTLVYFPLPPLLIILTL